MCEHIADRCAPQQKGCAYGSCCHLCTLILPAHNDSSPSQPKLLITPRHAQFFNIKRLTELYEREHAAEQHRSLMTQKEATLRGQVCALHRMAYGLSWR